MKIKLLHNDCIVAAKKLKDNSVDLILCDPPYKMTTGGKSCRPGYRKSNMKANLFTGSLPNTDTWIKECYRLLKDGTHFYIFTNTVSIREYLNSASEAGFKLHNIITMIKDTRMPSRWYYKETELVLFFRKGRAKPINDFSCSDNVNVIMPKKRTGKLHVTQKPLDFTKKLITNSTKKGETVADIFMGSGTTGVACVQTGRKFIGIEIDADYFKIAEERIFENTNSQSSKK